MANDKQKNQIWGFRTNRLLAYAIDNLSDPILVFDTQNHLQVYNDAAERILKVSSKCTLEQFVENNIRGYSVEKAPKNREKEREFTRTQVIGADTYSVYGKDLWDEKDQLVGFMVTYTDITGQERLKDEAILYATRDQLTGAWNRDYFFEIVKKTLKDNMQENFLMIVSDINHFKLFNEILGAEIGDDLLLAFAQIYREYCKKTWTFGRISADRFALVLPKTDYDENGFLKSVNEMLDRKQYSLRVHCYFGVYEITDKRMSVESMYDRAFLAVESIKGDLNKSIAYYHEELLSERIHETMTLDDLDRALKAEEFEIYLQPQVDIWTGAVISAEALIRWNKPGRGMVSPAEFIPIFENSGMIAKLDRHVWELACRQLRKWKDEGHTERSVSVNISAKDFCLMDLYECVTNLVEKYEISPVNLKLEITETALVLDVEKQMQMIRDLQNYGFVIEIDDFGSGYSSLNNLKEIKADMLKMDLKFFEKTGDPERAEKIVTSMIRLANELGMPVIAEGVETEEDMQLVRAAGCQLVQGYYYAKPMSVSDFEKYVSARPYGNMKAIIDRVISEME